MIRYLSGKIALYTSFDAMYVWIWDTNGLVKEENKITKPSGYSLPLFRKKVLDPTSKELVPK